MNEATGKNESLMFENRDFEPAEFDETFEAIEKAKQWHYEKGFFGNICVEGKFFCKKHGEIGTRRYNSYEEF